MSFIKDIGMIITKLFILIWEIIKYVSGKVMKFIFLNSGIFKYRQEIKARSKKLINSYNDNKDTEYL